MYVYLTKEAMLERKKNRHVCFSLIFLTNVRYVISNILLLLNFNATNEVNCTLRDVLVFCSGSDHIPPAGFCSVPSINFLLSKSELLPTASTCDLTIRLPTSHKDYRKFTEYMVLGVRGSKDFVGV